MSLPKIALLATWAAAAVCLFLPGEGGPVALGRWLFGILAVVHAIECVVFYRLLSDAPGGLASNLLQTLVFGVLHVSEVRAAQNAGGGPAT